MASRKNHRQEEYFSANPPDSTSILRAKKVFIAGAGGLGSNVAIALARAGVGSMTIVDFDKVEPSNLNRQQYFRDQVGMMKVDALRMNLARINPELKITTLAERITSSNCNSIISTDAEIIFECFDKAECKAYLTSFCLRKRSSIPLVAVSGLAGLGDCGKIKVHKGPGNSWIIGDGKTEMNPKNGTISSRVAFTAALQAHIGIRILLSLEKIK